MVISQFATKVRYLEHASGTQAAIAGQEILAPQIQGVRMKRQDALVFWLRNIERDGMPLD